MIGKLKSVVLDAPDIKALSAFYAEVGGWKQTYADDEWIALDGPPPWRLGFQLAGDDASHDADNTRLHDYRQEVYFGLPCRGAEPEGGRDSCLTPQ